MNNYQSIKNLVSNAMKNGEIKVRHEDCQTFQVGNILVKVMELPAKGMCVMQHAHHYDHMTLIGHGSVRVILDDVETDYQAPAVVEVKAHSHHALVALEDNTIAYCVHDVSKVDADDLGIPFKGD